MWESGFGAGMIVHADTFLDQTHQFPRESSDKMFERLKKAGARVTKLENLSLPKIPVIQTQEKEPSLCGVIRQEAILPDELNTTDYTKEQRKKRIEVGSVFWRSNCS